MKTKYRYNWKASRWIIVFCQYNPDPMNLFPVHNSFKDSNGLIRKADTRIDPRAVFDN